MDPKLVLEVFLIAGGAYTLIWAWIIASSKKQTEYSTLAGKISRLRRRLFYIFLIGMIIVFIDSIVYMPYEPIQTTLMGEPHVTITVEGSMFIWKLSRYQVPAGEPIMFEVTSIDVNHGFGLFTPEGALFAQVQAMPGYINKLIVVFSKPGRYTIRCLEYCGSDHYGMESFIDAT